MHRSEAINILGDESTINYAQLSGGGREESTIKKRIQIINLVELKKGHYA